MKLETLTVLIILFLLDKLVLLSLRILVVQDQMVLTVHHLEKLPKPLEEVGRMKKLLVVAAYLLFQVSR